MDKHLYKYLSLEVVEEKYQVNPCPLCGMKPFFKFCEERNSVHIGCDCSDFHVGVEEFFENPLPSIRKWNSLMYSLPMDPFFACRCEFSTDNYLIVRDDDMGLYHVAENLDGAMKILKLYKLIWPNIQFKLYRINDEGEIEYKFINQSVLKHIRPCPIFPKLWNLEK